MCLGIPGRVVEIVDPVEHRAMAEVDGVRREISLALFNEQDDLALEDDETVGVGDWVLIHVGFAMSKIDEEEAAETLEVLKTFGEAYDSEMEEFGAGGEMDPLDFNNPTPAAAPAGPAAAGPMGNGPMANGPMANGSADGDGPGAVDGVEGTPSQKEEAPT